MRHFSILKHYQDVFRFNAKCGLLNEALKFAIQVKKRKRLTWDVQWSKIIRWYWYCEK